MRFGGVGESLQVLFQVVVLGGFFIGLVGGQEGLGEPGERMMGGCSLASLGQGEVILNPEQGGLGQGFQGCRVGFLGRGRRFISRVVRG